MRASPPVTGVHNFDQLFDSEQVKLINSLVSIEDKLKDRGTMINLHSLPIDNVKEFKKNNSATDDQPEIIRAIPQRDLAAVKLDPALIQGSYIRLALEELKCFEVIEDQFSSWGLTLRNVVAIQPSNPVFAIGAGVTVLMGAPNSGLIEIEFQQPIRCFQGRVTSSRRTALSAYNQNDELIDQVELSGPNLASSQSMIPPNSALSVQGEGIYKIVFYAFDGQLIVGDIKFRF